MSRLSRTRSRSLPLPTFLLGQSVGGHWVVREVTRGLVQRRFADRKQAMRFALYGRGHRLGAVITTAKPLELEVP